MNRHSSIILLSLFVASCLNTEEQTPQEQQTKGQEMVFYAIADVPGSSRAVIESGGTEVWWEPGDSIKVFRGEDTGIFTADIEESSPVAGFKGSFATSSSIGEECWAVYPASAGISPGSYRNVKIRIPNVQTAAAGSFDKRAFVAIAKTMGDTLQFRNVCGGVKFSVSKPGIDKVTISNISTEKAYNLSGTGDFQINAYDAPMGTCDDEWYTSVSLVAENGSSFEPGVHYYICAVGAFEYPDGRPSLEYDYLRFSLYSGDELLGIYDYPGKKAVKRSTFGVIENLDERLTYRPSEIPKPEEVDLALKSGRKWASWNLGAASAEEPGCYYAWGELFPKRYYSWSDYQWCQGYYYKLTKYNSWSSMGPVVDYLKVLNNADDAVAYTLGEDWRMPNVADFEELRDDEDMEWQWTVVNGVEGYRITSKRNGNSLFLPAAGYFSDEQLNEDSYGYYKCRDASGRQSAIFKYSSTVRYRGSYQDRNIGASIRPVKDAPGVASYIELNERSLSLNRSKQFQLEATVYPTALEDKRLTWSSSDETVASVDGNGMVTALKQGSATITATAVAGGTTADCSVTVFVAPTGVTLSHESLTLYDETQTLEATVFPDDAPDKTLIWSSDDESVATVDENGVVHSNKLGYANITATAKDGGVSATCRIKVGDFTLGESSVSLVCGNKTSSTHTFIPEITHNTLSDTKVQYRLTFGNCTIDGNTLRAKTGGAWRDFVIASAGDLKDTCYVTIRHFSLSGSILFTGDGLDLNDLLVAGYSEQVEFDANWKNTMLWDIDDVECLQFSSAHIVQALAPGYTTLTATSPEGAVSSVIILVQNSSDAVEPEYVDLGLPSQTKWARCNLGAKSPEQLGAFYAWGDIVFRRDYTEYCWCDENNYYTKYNSLEKYGPVDGRTELYYKDDVANVLLGGHWYIPTKYQCEELFNNCDSEYYKYGLTTSGLVEGVIFWNKNHTDYIFFPFSGYCEGKEYKHGKKGDWGEVYLWTNTCSDTSEKAYMGYVSVYRYRDATGHSYSSGSVTLDAKQKALQIRPVTH